MSLDVPVRVLLDLSFNASLDQPVAAPSPITFVPAPNGETDLQLLFGNGRGKRRTFNECPQSMDNRQVTRLR